MSSGRRPRALPEAFCSTAQAALQAGWEIRQTARRLAWTSPSGAVVITAAAPGGRARVAGLASLRRAGLLRAPRRPASASSARRGGTR